MRVIAVDPRAPRQESIDEAAEALRRGGLVVFPTETVYGLGANALRPESVRRIFEVKGRPSVNPLIVHVPDIDAARRLASEWPDAAEDLGRRFWPGPLTLVVRKRADVPSEVTAGLDSVGLRVPSHPVAQAVLRAAKVPVAAPSANPFTRISQTTAEHVVKELGDGIDVVLDAGPTMVGIESTVVDVTRIPPVLLRPGGISQEDIERVVGTVSVQDASVADDVARASPGMSARHYAPRARVLLFAPNERPRVIAEAASGDCTGALLLSPLEARITYPITMPPNPTEYARHLYAALHDLEARECTLILVERVPDGPEWAGIRDRLERAAR
jgi:L-threonylcarbamoyladenylate synthase